MAKKKTLWDIKRAIKGQKNLDATRYKGKYHLLHILKNGNPVPLFISEKAKDVLAYINKK